MTTAAAHLTDGGTGIGTEVVVVAAARAPLTASGTDTALPHAGGATLARVVGAAVAVAGGPRQRMAVEQAAVAQVEDQVQVEVEVGAVWRVVYHKAAGAVMLGTPG